MVLSNTWAHAGKLQYCNFYMNIHVYFVFSQMVSKDIHSYHSHHLHNYIMIHACKFSLPSCLQDFFDRWEVLQNQLTKASGPHQSLGLNLLETINQNKMLVLVLVCGNSLLEVNQPSRFL